MDTQTSPPSMGEAPQQSAPQQQMPPSSGPTHNTGMAILCYIGILVLVPLLTEAKHDEFVKFHIKQGLVLLIFWILGSIFFWIPIFGWLLWIGVIVLMVMGIMAAANGQQKELPVIGQFAKNFHI